MTVRTILLSIHIAAVAAWLGADVLVHVLAPRFEGAGTPTEVATAWARAQVMLHERYYAAVVVVIVLSGVGLVQHEHWGWGSWFIWVGIGAVVLGASMGGIGLRSLWQRRLAALESGDRDDQGLRRKIDGLSILVSLVPIIAIRAMVGKWHPRY
jgi:protein-S-isoprenylcysteine O-methyltransferase Ste14